MEIVSGLMLGTVSLALLAARWQWRPPLQHARMLSLICGVVLISFGLHMGAGAVTQVSLAALAAHAH